MIISDYLHKCALPVWNTLSNLYQHFLPYLPIKVTNTKHIANFSPASKLAETAGLTQYHLLKTNELRKNGTVNEKNHQYKNR